MNSLKSYPHGNKKTKSSNNIKRNRAKGWTTAPGGRRCPVNLFQLAVFEVSVSEVSKKEWRRHADTLSNAGECASLRTIPHHERNG
ncbi:hypothetical protein ZHAS_00020000 [Anopheles sinensis]|uniref:Uncharacterized protein n=1 Tax=Anopheles sinensis TaxID=74873 RepID=A0A084WNP9_ANOSI|nr:hypothetical protein ZHAS_00020000 [Anopheles sinensis]